MAFAFDYAGKPFVAKDSRKTPVVLTPLYRLRINARGEPQKTLFPNDCVGLRTEDGRFVSRQDCGRYHLVDSGETLTSDDPNAV